MVWDFIHLYGHCSQLLVQEGDEVSAGDRLLQKQEKQDLAMGDHLHFGMVIQGYRSKTCRVV